MAPAEPFKLNVLVVDDEHDTAEAIATALRHYGHTVQIALSGLSALEIIRVDEPDVVFLDLVMPDLDGMEVARRIRAAPCHKPPFLVAITGLGDDEDYRRSLAAGIDLHLVKPVDLHILQDFLTRFRRVIE